MDNRRKKNPETGALHGVYCTIYSGLGEWPEHQNFTECTR